MGVTTDCILSSLNYHIIITSLPADGTLQKSVKNVYTVSLDVSLRRLLTIKTNRNQFNARTFNQFLICT